MAMTVEELAAKSGLSVRNIRSYQTRGLLQPPGRFEGKRRVAAYDNEHLERLRLIEDLRSRGFTLTAISKMSEASEGDLDISALLDAARGSRTGSQVESPALPIEVSASELADSIGAVAGDPALLARSISLGLIEPRGDRYLVNSPVLFEAGARLMDAGIPPEALFDALEHLQRGIRAALSEIAESFRKLVWEPSSKTASEPDGVETAISMIGDLPRLTRDAVDAALDHELRNAPLVRLLTRDAIRDIGRALPESQDPSQVS